MSIQLPQGIIDFAGQKQVDQISRVWLIASTVISFIAGFTLQNIRVTFGFLGVSTVLLLAIVIPPWPMFNQHPVTWLPVIEEKKKKKT
ncbi:microsomal signal peptidase 12kda subunit [Moniliophthora roreri MCA 2997]|uniref:Signal peptidase complex subunit 1 n=2 Tax=Moniliophthora roreri TaxID=221103 RepID=V2WTR9_MONRO|nr:microsomal signal peptidase 12kda subunit [Moniliophthora roreri MCA 2997]KAI3605821.1 microsomal signal peptidase 12kda subunit [Moniliophthora roreri]